MTELDMTTLLIFIFAAVSGFAFGAYRGKAIQNRSEAAVAEVLRKNFRHPDYHLLNHVTLRLPQGTTQIDQILVSRFGVFVIETKDYKGWIFADTRQKYWTQVLFRKKFRFQNPLIQNMGHVRAVKALLDFLPSQAVISSVVFAGSAEFKSGIPEGVFSVGAFVNYVRSHTSEVMSVNRLQFCVGRLETERLSLTNQTDVEHIQHVRRRYGGGD